MTIPEAIDKEYGVFLFSEDAAELERNCAALTRILEYDRPNERNRENAEALLFRMKAKALALRFYGDFQPEEGDALLSYLEKTAPHAREKGYQKTFEALSRLLSLTQAVKPLTDGAFALLYKLRRDGQWLVTSSAECDSPVAFFEEAIKKAEVLESGAQIFGAKVRVCDLKERTVHALQAERDELIGLRDSFVNEEEARLLADAATILEPKGEYFPAWKDERTGANAVVLSTPFLEEARLAAAAYARERGRQAAELNAASFSGKTEERLGALFAALSKRGNDCLVTGLNGYRGDKKAALREIVRFAKGGRHAFILDDSGKRVLYDEAIAAIAGEGSPLDVGYRYLTMPDFRDTVALFEERGMIADSGEYGEIRARMPFMGYAGLNAAASAFTAGKDWKKIAEAYSQRNRARALAYLSAIPSQNQLLDEDWGKFGGGDGGDVNGKRKFDYDDVRGINPRNIAKILAGEGNFFAKCGAVVRYCTLCGDDVSVWKELSRETKSERLTAATRLLMRMLDTGLEPEVLLIAEEEWKDMDSGGLCVDGGKSIRYRESNMRDYDWAVQTVCHECYHAFQHMAINGGWRNWYWEELGVTPNRFEEWRYNFANYNGNTKSVMYRVEIVECDARTFQRDCFTMSEDFWHKIDFE